MSEEPHTRDLRDILKKKPNSSGLKSQLEFHDGPGGSVGITTAQGRRNAEAAERGQGENGPKPQKRQGGGGGGGGSADAGSVSGAIAGSGAVAGLGVSIAKGRRDFDRNISKNQQSPRDAGNPVAESGSGGNRTDKDQHERHDQNERYNIKDTNSRNDNDWSRGMKDKGAKRSRDEAQWRLDGGKDRRSRSGGDTKYPGASRSYRGQGRGRPQDRDGHDELRNDIRGGEHRPAATTETRENEEQQQQKQIQIQIQIPIEETRRSPAVDTASGLQKIGSKRERVETSTMDDADPSGDPKRAKYERDRQGNGSKQYDKSNTGSYHGEHRPNDREFNNRNSERGRYSNDDRSRYGKDRLHHDERGDRGDERDNAQRGTPRIRDDPYRSHEKPVGRSDDDRDRGGERGQAERERARYRGEDQRDRSGYRNDDGYNNNYGGGAESRRLSSRSRNDRDDRYRSERDSANRETEPFMRQAGDLDNNNDLLAKVGQLIMTTKSDFVDNKLLASILDQIGEFKEYILRGGEEGFSSLQLESRPFLRSRGIRKDDFVKRLGNTMYNVYRVKILSFPEPTKLPQENEIEEADHGSMIPASEGITSMGEAHADESAKFVAPVATIDPIEARFGPHFSRLKSLQAGMDRETDETLNNAFCLNDIGVLTESIRLSDLLKLNSVWSGSLYVNPQISEAHACGVPLAGTLVPSPYYEETVKEHTYSLFKEGTPKLKVFSTVPFRVLTNVFSRSTVLMLVCPQPIKFSSLPARKSSRKETLEIRLANAEDKHHFERQMYQNRFSIREFRRYVEHLVIREQFAACIWQDDGTPYIDWMYLMPPVDFTLNMFDIPIDRFPFKHVFLAAITKASRDDPRKLLLKQSPPPHESANVTRKE